MKIEKPKLDPRQIITPKPIPEIRMEERNDLETQPSLENKEEEIIEFLYDIFQENEKISEPSTVPKEPDPL